MDSFVDKPFCDMNYNDLHELWDADLDPTLQDALRLSDTDTDWGIIGMDMKRHVLNDRLITDAAFGTLPIKSEHSYSLASDGDSGPDSPISLDANMDDDDDMENECFPAMPMSSTTSASQRDSKSSTSSQNCEFSTNILIKDEPISEPSSPEPEINVTDDNCISTCDLLHMQSLAAKGQHSVLKQSALLLSSRNATMNHVTQSSMFFPKLNIKLEPNLGGFSLPPTPPSSAASDSEGNVSPLHHPHSPSGINTTIRNHNSNHIIQHRQQLHHTARLLVPSSVTASQRQPIQTPLISTQPKGSTGMLTLTDEEKRTLIAEGYPIPNRLPLTKAEEKSLKKIRRKIKNKISAQESRRKKKEYMDALERKVDSLTSDCDDSRKKMSVLENTNATLLSQIQRLQAALGEKGYRGGNNHRPGRTVGTQTLKQQPECVVSAKEPLQMEEDGCYEVLVVSQ